MNDTQIESHLNNLCKVCGDKAHINNYGALSCSSCKIFFRRHGFHPENIHHCNLNEDCETTIISRRICTACRFAKCLAVGMNPDQIRKEDLSKRLLKQKQLLVAQLLSTSQLPTLSLLSTDRSSLTILDWRLLSNVVHAFDTYTPVSKARSLIEYASIQSSMEQSLNLMSLIYSSLESFINSTADFRIMTTAEQRSLIQRNMHGLWAFHSIIVFHKSGVFDNIRYERILLPLYGSANVQCTKRLSARLDYDLTFIKLMLMTLIFSSNLFTITEDENMPKDSLLYGTFRLFGSQNVYAGLMWKYLIYRYDFFESAKRFAILIKIILDMIKLASDINESNKTHHRLADEIIEQTERSLSLDDHENELLWGKT